MWVAVTDLPTAVSHPFYRRLNQFLREHGFDDFTEAQCASFYAETMGRPGLPPGIYFRLLLIGYFEGIDSERGIAWRAADSLQCTRIADVSTAPAANGSCADVENCWSDRVRISTRPADSAAHMCVAMETS